MKYYRAGLGLLWVLICSVSLAQGQADDTSSVEVLAQEQAEKLADRMARAAEIGFRLDLELGQVEAAQRHLLIARLNLALAKGDWDAASAQRFESWRGVLDSLETQVPMTGLAAWPELSRIDGLDDLLRTKARMLPVDWPPRQAELTATALTLLTEDPRGRLVRSLYPQQLAWASANAAQIWSELLRHVDESQELLPLIEPLVADWLALPLSSPIADWQLLTDAAAEHLAQAPGRPTTELAQQIDILLSDRLLVEHALPPLHLRQVAYTQTDLADRGALALAAAVRQLPAGNYQQLIGVMLALVAETGWPLDESQQQGYAAIIELLQRIDGVLLPQLEQTDPVLLSSYQRSRALLRETLDMDGQDQERLLDFRRRTVDLMMSVRLGIDNLSVYLDQPLRRPIEQEITVCLGLIEQAEPLPAEVISAEQFTACLRNLARAATEYASTPELAGTPAASWEPSQLARETSLNPWQRINYWHGWLNDTLDCEIPVDLVNPLEWALTARALSRFVDRWPAYYSTRSPLPSIDQVIRQGQRLVDAQVALANCGQSGPMLAILNQYRQALDHSEEALTATIGRLRADQLAPDADVDLSGPATQSTAFRPADVMVGPCDEQASCGMREPLEASPALLSLFEQPFLVGHQIGAGAVSLCYDNVRWVDRRAEVPAVRQQAMANYFAKLSFDLHGHYSEQAQPIFSLRLTSREEQEYLFGANTEEVLNDACPRDLVDSQVLGELMPRRFQLVPRRLTYVTAERSSPTRLFAQNWSEQEQWRESLTTGRGVEVLQRSRSTPYLESLNARLRELNQQWDRTLYGWMLYDDPMGRDQDASQLSESSRELDLYRGIAERVGRLVAPRSLVETPALRASLRGSERPMDRSQILRFQGNGMPAEALLPVARAQLRDAMAAWRDHRTSERQEVDPIIDRTLLELIALRRRVAALN